VRRTLLAMAALLLAADAQGDAPLDPEALTATLDAQVPAAMAARRIPGAAIVVVDADGTLFERGYGVENLASREPIDPERTVFRVASVSKLFTATAAMQLVERDVLDLDRDVNDALSTVRVPRLSDRPVTLRHLLTHTAGLGARFLGYAAHDRADLIPLGDYLAQRLPSPFLAPGQVFSYANHGTALAGLLVAEAHGVPFAQAVEASLFAPLGMRSSHFDPPPALTERMATGYVLAGGEPRPLPLEYQHALPAGSLVTSAHDMARFLRAHLSGGALDGRSILQPDSVATMQQKQFSHHPRMRGIGIGFLEYEVQGWRCVGHDGDTGGFNARAFLVPELGIGLFVAYTGSDSTKRFADDVTRLVLGPVARATRVEMLARRAPPADLSRLAGTYRWTRYDRDTFGKGLMAYPHFQFQVEALDTGVLRIAARPVPVFPTRDFAPVGEGLFQADDGSLATFREDEGRTTHLLFNPSGVLPMAFERIARWRSAAVQLALIGLFAWIWPILALGLALALRKQRLFDAELRPAAFLVLAAALANTGFLTFPATTGLAFFGEDLGLPAFLSSAATPQHFFGPSGWMLAVLALPLVALGLEAMVAFAVARAWRDRRGRLGARAALTTLLLLGAGFAALLNEWNLLGYRL
jgi:CubicO group peptidase (beta-lactamase class C family)